MGNFFPTHQLVFDYFGFINWNGKADTHSIRTNGCVNANNFSSIVQQRASGITWVNCSIGLNKIKAFVRDTNLGAGTFKRADNSQSDGVIKSQRITNCDRPVSHLHVS